MESKDKKREPIAGKSNDNKTVDNQIAKDRRKRKTKLSQFLIFSLMFIVFVGSIALIYYPSFNSDKEQVNGINSNIPQPTDNGIVDDKRVAYEQEKVEQQRFDRIQSLNAFAGKTEESDMDNKTDLLSLALEDSIDSRVAKDDQEDKKVKVSKAKHYSGKYSGSKNPDQAIKRSAKTYSGLNNNLNNFYSNSPEDREKEELKAKVNRLEQELSTQPTATNSIDEQVALMEKSYELAAKYNQVSTPSNSGVFETDKNREKTYSIDRKFSLNNESDSEANQKDLSVEAVTNHKRGVVSSLYQPMSDTLFISQCSKPRNLKFNTVGLNKRSIESNTISVSVYKDQTISDGQTVSLRLLEPMQISSGEIPRNTTISGLAKVKGERLIITVESVGYSERVIPVKLIAYDMDGQQGIYIPNSLERNAIKEIASNMGTSVGTSLSITSDAGQQIAADLGKSLIQGGSQYISQKMKMVKVHLKSGYKMMLLSSK